MGKVWDEIEWILFDRFNYMIHYIRYRKNQIVFRVTGKDYWGMPRIVAGKPLLSICRTNKIIFDAILADKPFWAGRFGGTEMNAIYEVLSFRFHPNNDKRKDAVNRLCFLSGFFPERVSEMDKFVDMMLECSANIDLQGEWRRYMEDYIYIKYQKNTLLTQLFYLEPWNALINKRGKGKPWSAALKGKKVLVIHPFSESIQYQYYNNREHIFEKICSADEILPKFELITLKAVQTLAEEKDARFDTWFDALEWMVCECRKISFDVAIVGCGAYGYPLASKIKEMGKVVIHLGGATQLLFGIMGSRWEQENPEFCKRVVNHYWIRPLEQEKIKRFDEIEKGCYW